MPQRRYIPNTVEAITDEFSALDLGGPIRHFDLLRLPTELHRNVCEHMDDGDLIECHLASRKMAEESSFVFGTRFFGSLVFIDHPFGLNALLEIARHPGLSTYVKTVAYSAEGGLMRMFKVTRGRRVKRAYGHLPTPHECALVLAEALRSFRNLESVEMVYAVFDDKDDHPGVRCGFGDVLRDIREVPGGKMTLEPDPGHARDYEILFTAIEVSTIAENLTLDIYISSSVNSWNITSDTKPLFDTNSTTWRAVIAPRVRALRMSQVQAWGHGVIESVPELNSLSVCGDYHSTHDGFDAQITGLLPTWSGHLSSLKLERLIPAPGVVLNLLIAHETSLSSIDFKNIF